MRFLIIDEKGDYAKVLVKFLEDKGCEVEHVLSSNVESPLSILQDRRSEVIDILIFHTGMMPQAQALTFCSFARQLWSKMIIVIDGIGSSYLQVADFVDVRPGPSELREIIQMVSHRSVGK